MNRMQRLRGLCLALALTAVVVLLSTRPLVAGPENVLVNGSFEEPDISEFGRVELDSLPGWNGFELVLWEAQADALMPQGAQFILMGTNLYQDFATVPGQAYVLRFLASPGGDTFDVEDIPPARLRVLVNGAQVLFFSRELQHSEYFTVNFVATSTTTRLEFLNIRGDGFRGSWWLDDVSVVPIPGAVAVPVDIKPGSSTNPINLKSRGVISVAILSTATFDAATADPSSVEFGPNAATSTQNSMEDVDGDGRLDLVLHFRTRETGIHNGDTQTCLTGQTNTGLVVKGCDGIRTKN